MSKIFSSASKIVFLLVALTMCVAFIAVVFKNLTNEQVSTAVISLASIGIGSAFTFYFTKKSDNQTPTA